MSRLLFVRLDGLILFSLAAALYAGPPILHSDFVNDTAGWIAVGSPSASVKVTADPLAMRVGEGALEFAYESSSEHPAVAALPLSQSLAGAKVIRTWLRSSSPMAVAVVLDESGGGRYVAISWIDAMEWRLVELTPEDFVLGHGPGDPQDPDGKLDLDQIRSIAILDLSQTFPQTFGHGKAPLAVNAHEGPQRLWIEGFEVSAEAPSWYKPRTPFLIDDFSHPQPMWFSPGAADISIDKHTLRIAYQQLDDRFTVFVKQLPKHDFTGATQLSFDTAAEHGAQLFVILTEEESGLQEQPRYRAEVDISPGSSLAHHEIPLEDFEHDDNGPADPDGELDLNKLSTITITDATGAFSQKTRFNTLRISNLRMEKSKAAK